MTRVEELADAKAGLGGEMESEDENNRFGGGGKQRSVRRGLQPGRGHLDAERPEDDIDAGMYDTKVRQKVGRGAVSVTGQLDGPNAKGRVEQAIQSQFEAAQASRGRSLGRYQDAARLPRARAHVLRRAARGGQGRQARRVRPV